MPNDNLSLTEIWSIRWWAWRYDAWRDDKSLSSISTYSEIISLTEFMDKVTTILTSKNEDVDILLWDASAYAIDAKFESMVEQVKELESLRTAFVHRSFPIKEVAKQLTYTNEVKYIATKYFQVNGTYAYVPLSKRLVDVSKSFGRLCDVKWKQGTDVAEDTRIFATRFVIAYKVWANLIHRLIYNRPLPYSLPK